MKHLQPILWTLTALLSIAGAAMALYAEVPGRGIGVEVAGLTLAVATYALQERTASRAPVTVALDVEHLDVHR